MTRNIIITACVLGIGTSLGFAEEKAAAQQPSSTSPSTSEYQPQHLQLFDSSVVENKRVTDASGKNLGKLERLLIDSQTGIVRFVVVQADKEWSLNDPEVIIPWGALQISRQGEKEYSLKIDADRNKLMGAPHFDKALVHQLTSREAGAPIYSYWGIEWRDTQGVTGTAQSRSLAPSTPSSSSTATSTDLSVTGTGSATSTSPTTSGPTSTAPTSTTSSPDATTTTPSTTTPGTSTTPDANATTPNTTTDGSLGRQPLGNTGTSDSPKPDSSQGQSRELNTEPLDPEYETGEPDRARGGNETD